MNDATCPVPVPDGGVCRRASFDESLPFPLCREHLFAVRRWDYREAAERLRAEDPAPPSIVRSVYDRYVRGESMREISRGVGIPLTTVHRYVHRARGMFPERVPTSIVYYVRVGDRVKIGTTIKTVRERFQGQLPPDAQVLATEPGSFETERKRHRQFRHLQDANEWFHGGPEIWKHVAELRKLHGDPQELIGG